MADAVRRLVKTGKRPSKEEDSLDALLDDAERMSPFFTAFDAEQAVADGWTLDSPASTKPTKKKQRHRSKSLGRAIKRKDNKLQSQQPPPDETTYDRARAIHDAMEANATFARNRVVAWPDCDAWRPKSMFDLYYKLQRIVSREEWDAFSLAIRRPLPITFRYVRGDAPADFRAEGEAILERWMKVGTGTRRLGLVDGWQLHIDKHVLRAAEAGSEEALLREWLIRGTDAGYLIRQEVASMLPGALVDVQPNSTVLDMCAAPGSKTTQLVERLADARAASSSSDAADGGGGGVVVANDASALRAYTLVKRTASLGARAAGLIVTCHRGQCMPQTPSGAPNFDRIICDVPCTGDGTTRKHPEVFARWEVALGMRQHILQLQIAMRGASLLEVGGRMVYSTCSLNPIENESVVAEMLRRSNGAIVLEEGAAEVASQLAGGCAPGMTSWSVLDFRLNRHDDLASLKREPRASEAEKRLFTQSMWPPSSWREAEEVLHLNRCVRLLPHRSDSGGFFVALLRKVRPFSLHPSPEWPRRLNTKMVVEDDEEEDEEEHAYRPIGASVASALAPHLGGGDQKKEKKAKKKAKKEVKSNGAGDSSRLFARSGSGKRVVYLTAKAALCVGAGSKLRVVHAGATVFKKRKAAYAITAEGEKLLR